MTVSRDGHDISGATAQLPTNAECGMMFYDTTKKALYVANGSSTMEPIAGARGYVAVTAAGTNQGNAASLTDATMNVVASADGTKGVILPTAVPGHTVTVYNNSASALNVYPATSGTLAGGSANAGITIPGLGTGGFTGTSTTNWATTVTGSISGSATLSALTGTAAPFPIAGLAAAQGGAVTVTGGASSTSGNAGGAVTLVGGAGGATGIGGAVTSTGAAGGATSGAGGAVTNTGGAGTAGNAAGGAVANVGGAGQGSAAGGASNLTGGAGGATGTGGACLITGGAGGATSGVGGAVTLTGGVGTAGNSAGGASSLVGGAGQGSAAGGASLVTGGAGGATGAGGAITITSGAGGATSGAAGAIAITVGSCTSGNGANLTLTAGNGASGTNSGGNVNLIPGAAVSTGTPGEVQVNSDANLFFVTEALTATDATRTVMVATRACRLKSVKEVHSTASTSGTLQLEKCTGTTAPGSGSSLLTGTMSLSGTANTVVSGTLVSTVATITFAAGDRLSIVIAGTMTNLAGGRVTIGLTPV